MEKSGSIGEDTSSRSNDNLEPVLSPTFEDRATKNLMLKLDLRILPTLMVIYFMSFLDR